MLTVASVPYYVNEVCVWHSLNENQIDLLRRSQQYPNPSWPKPYWKAILLDEHGDDPDAVAVRVTHLLTVTDGQRLDTSWCLWWKGCLLRYDDRQFVRLPL